VTLPNRLKPYAPTGFSAAARAYSSAVCELQERRHSADYDPLGRFVASDAEQMLAIARSALHSIGEMPDARLFCALLLFPPRRSR